MEKCIYSIFLEAEVSVLHFKVTDLICFIVLRLSGEQGRCVPISQGQPLERRCALHQDCSGRGVS